MFSSIPPFYSAPYSSPSTPHHFPQRLLDYGLDPNSYDHDLRGPLHVAAAESFVHISKLLLENGADPWARDRLDLLPVDEAMRSGSKPVVALLKDYMRRRLPGVDREHRVPGGPQAEAVSSQGRALQW